jgi:hypothetical protein
VIHIPGVAADVIASIDMITVLVKQDWWRSTPMTVTFSPCQVEQLMQGKAKPSIKRANELL